MPLTIEGLQKARDAGLDDDRIINAIQHSDPEISKRFESARSQGLDNGRILRALEHSLSQKTMDIPPKDDNVSMVPRNAYKSIPETPTQQQKSPGIISSFKSGIRQSSTGEINKLLNGDYEDEPEMEMDFIDSISHSIGNIIGGTPAFIAGGVGGASAGSAVGGPIGAAAGSGAGAFALDEFIKEAITQFREHQQGGEDLTFGEFLQRSEKVSGSTLRGGAMGGILSTINAAAPILMKVPGLGKLFETKLGSHLGTTAAEVATLGTVPAVSEGRLPTANEYAHAAALVFGLHIPRLARIALMKEGEKSGLLPEEFAKTEIAKKIVEDSQQKPENETNKTTEVPKSEKSKADQETKASEKTEDKITFKTSKGSSYTVEENGATTRNKKYRPEHGESEQGPQPTSEKTYYVSKEDVDKLSLFQTQGDSKSIYEFPDGRIGVIYNSGKNKGKIESRSVVTPKTEPGIGLTPVELWNKGSQVHFGNEITEVNHPKKPKQSKEQPKSGSLSIKPSQLSIKKSQRQKAVALMLKREKRSKYNLKKKKSKTKKPQKEPEPIIETTGKSAYEQMEPEPTLSGKIKEAGKTVVDAVSNPKQLRANINTGLHDALNPIRLHEKDIPVAERVTTKIKQAQSAASDINNILDQGVFDNEMDRYTSRSLKSAYVEQGEVWKKITKGLQDHEYSVEDMNAYRLSKEALKRQKRGLKSGIDTQKSMETVNKLKQKYGPIDQRIHDYQRGVVDHYGKDTLTPEARKQWTQESHASLYRAMDYGKDAAVAQGSLNPKKWWHRAKGSVRKILPPSESDALNTSMIVTNGLKNDSILQYKKLVEEGKMPGKIVKSKNRALPEKFMEDLEIDPENVALAETIYNQSRIDAFTPEVGRIRGWSEGKPFEIEVPKDIYNTFASLPQVQYGNFVKFLGATSRLFSKATVLEPVKRLSITTRDALNSLVYSKTGNNPINMAKAFFDVVGNKEGYQKFKALGGEQYSARLMSRMDRISKMDDLLKIESPNAIIKPFKDIINVMSKFGNDLSVTVPYSEYKSALKKFGDTPNGRLAAIIEAKSVTNDPTTRGSNAVVKTWVNIAPFANPMIQEPFMIGRNFKDPGFWARGALVYSIPALMQKWLNEGNEDYEALSPIMKAAFYHFYVNGQHIAFPNAWLTCALFKNSAEMVWDFAKNEGGETWKGTYSYVASQMAGAYPPTVTALYEQTSGKPIPTPGATVMFPFKTGKRSPDVVPKRLQNLPPEQQYTSRTSQTAIWWGSLWGASPVKVDRLIKTFTGGSGADVLALIDSMVYASGMAEDKRPDDYFIMGKFVADMVPSQTKYAEEFYSKLEAAHYDKERDKPNDLKDLNKQNTKISKALREYRDIEDSNADPKSKKQQLQSQQRYINSLYKDAIK